MIEQITEIIDQKNLTATQFADEIGIQRSSLSHVLSGRNKPSLDFMLKIKSRYPEINLDWLLMGEGKMTMQGETEEKKIVSQDFTDERKSTETYDLFTGGKVSSKNEPEVKEVENEVRSEEQGVYQKKMGETESIPDKIIILYPDNTFTIYKQKG